MKLTGDFDELVGKTVAVSWIRQFSDDIMVATTEGTTILFTQHFKEDELGPVDDSKETFTYPPQRAWHIIMNNKGMVKELKEQGVLTDNEIREHETYVQRKNQEILQGVKEKEKEQRYQQYIKLKEEFE